MVWKLAEAKNKFSEVVDLALHSGPQTISRRGDKVILINEKSYHKLCGKKPSFLEFLLSGPSFDGVDLTRDKSPMRDISL